MGFNPLNAELNPICPLLVLLGAHLILHISRIRVNFAFEGLKPHTFFSVVYWTGTFVDREL